MLESLGISEQDFTILVSAAATFVAGIIISFRGAKKGKPTSSAVAAAITAAPMCKAREDLGPTLEHMAEKLHEIEKVQRQQDVTLARLDERTRRD